ncbi:MAG: TlpA disulfide reductase family protein [Candidatus Pseudobacter hemicellulosilyticus]|uniref:TlpA disulfide reductase family protein n=1 Tax=Candidatus Pseudobacter hemicellulosilyticus TaxID=3121375 RepID=A0AAJ6BF95_9BACT|nr:MAG: TlpA disulfide reductase family protein [Pseudobacter sp.]
MRSLLSILLLAVGLCGSAQEIKKVKITDLETYIKQADHPLLVNFWATWCAPCVEELPWLDSAVRAFAGSKVELLLVSLDFDKDYPAAIEAFRKKHHYKATWYWLDETNADYFCPKIDARWDGNIPASLFINNKTGYRKFFSRQLTHRQVVPAIREMLELSTD